ncbi:MAG: hypothetical protein JXA46_02150 [Dehalococcoidales bacterium]|nr:hypothetical protein [Dehalococcoidales bacterium]
MLKKILALSLIAIALIGLTAAGTRAFFSDTETSWGNNVTSGTLDLQVGDYDPMTESISLDNIKPTDSGRLATWEVYNNGSLTGEFYISIGAVDNQENGASEVEIASGDPGDAEGELGGLITLAMWMDNGGNGWSDGDYYLDLSGSDLAKTGWSSGSVLPEEAYFIADYFGGKESSELQQILPDDSPGNFCVDFIFPDNGAADNQAQSDSCTFDIEFTLKQH